MLYYKLSINYIKLRLITANTRYTFCLFNQRIQKSLFFESIDKITEKLNDFFTKVRIVLKIVSYELFSSQTKFLLKTSKANQRSQIIHESLKLLLLSFY
jgi:hypothetical protein